MRSVHQSLSKIRELGVAHFSTALLVNSTGLLIRSKPNTLAFGTFFTVMAWNPVTDCCKDCFSGETWKK